MQIKHKFKDTKGITLIALVITIVVLIILATITINIAINGGIFQASKETKPIKEKAEIIEIAQMDILGKKALNEGNITEEDLEEILTSSKYSTQGTLSDNGESSILEKTLTTRDGKYTILVSEIYNGPLKLPPGVIRTDKWTLTDNDHDNKISIGDLVTPLSTNISSESFYIMDIKGGEVILLASSYVSIDALSQTAGNEWYVKYNENGVACEYEDGPSIKHYVDEYVKKLKKEGVSIIQGRLITADEVLDLGGDTDSSDFREYVPNFLWCGYNSYWTGNVSPEWGGYSGECIVVMNEDYGELNFSYIYPAEEQWGVSLRPVIVINKNDIQL